MPWWLGACFVPWGFSRGLELVVPITARVGIRTRRGRAPCTDLPKVGMLRRMSEANRIRASKSYHLRQLVNHRNEPPETMSLAIRVLTGDL